ncbi:MAG: translation elongation factor Ts [Candidatus Colwellbacteria bacterium]|nr:translation elongation factor Ts [Candidatus Colwellbacteria bacterium]
MFKTTDVQKLREMTGAPVMDCKRALQDASGDFDKAITLINERGLVKAQEKASREANAGIVESYIHNSRVGVMLELFCETDFVCRSDPFRELAHDLALQIAAMDPKDLAELLEQPYIKDEKIRIDELVKGVVARVGENVRVGRFIRYEI